MALRCLHKASGGIVAGFPLRSSPRFLRTWLAAAPRKPRTPRSIGDWPASAAVLPSALRRTSRCYGACQSSPQLTEDNVRQGFLEQWQYERLLTKLPERLKALFVCAYHVGTRKGELRKIHRSQVDIEDSKIHFKVRPPLGADLQRDAALAGAPEATGSRWLPLGIFIPLTTRRRASRRLARSVRARSASLGRNMTRAGIPRPVAMAITGHKTQSMYRRYDIASEADLSGAGEQMERYLLNQRKARLQRVR